MFSFKIFTKNFIQINIFETNFHYAGTERKHVMHIDH